MKRFALAVAVYAVVFARQGPCCWSSRNCGRVLLSAGPRGGNSTRSRFSPRQSEDAIKQCSRCTADVGEDRRGETISTPAGRRGGTKACHAPCGAWSAGTGDIRPIPTQGFFYRPEHVLDGSSRRLHRRHGRQNPAGSFNLITGRNGSATASGFTKADVVVGHSMGTAVGMEMALLFPERVGSLILLNGPYTCTKLCPSPLPRSIFCDCVRGLRCSLSCGAPPCGASSFRVRFLSSEVRYIFGSPRSNASRGGALDFTKVLRRHLRDGGEHAKLAAVLRRAGRHSVSYCPRSRNPCFS